MIPTNLKCYFRNESLILYKEIANSGEGKVYTTNKSGFLAKIYHSVNQDKINKLVVMVQNPPPDPTRSQGHISIAWPNDLVINSSNQVLGFLMPAIPNGQTLINVYNPRLRNKKALGFNWLYLHTTALNIALILNSLHSKGYVVGDLKTDNLLVNHQGLVSIIDTDSFQIVDPKTRKIFRCDVATPEYTPREIFGKDLKKIDRYEVQDRFGLAVIIWLLLFGQHPFGGTWNGSGNPSLDERIRNGHWIYQRGSKVSLGKTSIPIHILHPELQKCFLQCFNDGHNTPSRRPSSIDWGKALTLAIQDLMQCSVVSGHFYARSYGKCYWCERKRQLKSDVFSFSSPAVKIAQQQTHSPSPQKPASSSYYSSQFSKIPLSGFFKNRISLLNLKLYLIPKVKTKLFAIVIVIGIGVGGYQGWQSQFSTKNFQNVVLQENFQSPSNWSISQGAKFKDGGLFHQQPKVNWSGWSFWNGHQFTDVDFSADVAKVSGSNDSSFGLLARISGENHQNFYYLLINGNGEFTMGKNSQGNWNTSIKWKESKFINKGNSYNRLRIVCKGEYIIGFINGKRVGIFKDNSFSSGKIGFESSRGQGNAVAVYFDNLITKEPKK